MSWSQSVPKDGRFSTHDRRALLVAEALSQSVPKDGRFSTRCRCDTGVRSGLSQSVPKDGRFSTGGLYYGNDASFVVSIRPEGRQVQHP